MTDEQIIDEARKHATAHVRDSVLTAFARAVIASHEQARGQPEDLLALRKRVAELESEVERLRPKPPKMGYAGFSACGCWNRGTYGENNHYEYKCPAHAALAGAGESK